MKIQHRNRLERIPNMMPEKILLLFLYATPLIGVAFLALGLWMAVEAVKGALIALFMGLVLIFGGITSIQNAMAEFTFSESGVTVKYPMEKPRQIPWVDFREVCVCYYSNATEMYGYTILCMVKKGERKNNFGRWKTASPFHYRSVLCLDFSEELLENVKKYCPYSIPDFRDQGNYRI